MTCRTALTIAALSPLLAYAGGQGKANRASPHETVSVDVDAKKITISYGRPYLKGREVGNEVAPYGQVWRLGADEATKITIPSPMTLGGSIQLAPGSYSLFAVPQADKWTLIVNKVADQWGAFKYQKSEDVGRVDLPTKLLSTPVEQFTITLDKQSSNTATLTLAWGKTSVSTELRTR